MKRLLSLILTVIMMTSAFSCYVNAAKDYIIPNPPVTVVISSPTVDGIINENEGWSDPCYMNEDTTYSHWYVSSFQVWAESRFALDKSGFYFSANILEGLAAYDPTYDSPSWTNSRCPMKGEMKDNVVPYGDKFYLHIDPLCKFYDGREHGGVDYVPEYMVCIDEDEKIHIQGCHKVITDKVRAKGAFTEGGWRFEVFIPWDVIIGDVYDVSKVTPDYGYGNYVINVNEIVNDGSSIKVGLQYDDQYINEYGEYENGYSYFTPFATRQGGMPTVGAIIRGVDVLGIDLTVSDVCTYGSKHRWTGPITLRKPTHFDKGREMILCNVCGEVRYNDIEALEYKDDFVDVRQDAWYFESVIRCLEKGYMKGMNNNVFSPNTALTREQCVVMLANVMGEDTEGWKNVESGFTDVPTGTWYSGAVAWATRSGFVKGVSEDKFGTGMYIQRAAFCRLLYMIAGELWMDRSVQADMTVYEDYHDIPGWASKGISWAVANNIIVSTKTDALMVSPYAPLTRAQAAVMLTKFDEIK